MMNAPSHQEDSSSRDCCETRQCPWKPHGSNQSLTQTEIACKRSDAFNRLENILLTFQCASFSLDAS